MLNEAGPRQAEEDRVDLLPAWWEPGPPGMAMTEVRVAAGGLEWTGRDVADAVAAILRRVE